MSRTIVRRALQGLKRSGPMRIGEQPKATVVITTKDRKDELRRALRSACTQSASTEVLVIDDGSTDGTAHVAQQEFPQVRLVRSEVSRGLVVQRNRAARLATAPVIFSLDDDAAFSSPHTVEQTLAEFGDPRVGAVAIPYLEPQKANRILQQTPSHDGVWVTDTFIGTAHALRRDVFLELGGYRESLFHQGEESDFCIRMLDAGYLVRVGNADVIYHYESPRRDFRRMDIYGRRNDVLFAWHNVPARFLPLHLATTTLNGLRWGFKTKRLANMIWGLLCGYLACAQYLARRRPVRANTYKLFRRLKQQGPVELERIASISATTGGPAHECGAELWLAVSSDPTRSSES